MIVAIKIAGEAKHVYKLLSLLTMYRGEDTNGKIVEEKMPWTIFLLCRGNETNTSLTGLQYEDTLLSKLA